MSKLSPAVIIAMDYAKRAKNSGSECGLCRTDAKHREKYFHQVEAEKHLIILADEIEQRQRNGNYADDKPKRISINFGAAFWTTTQD